MTLDLIVRLLRASRFVPFKLHLADGRTISVGNPELIMIADDSRSLSVFEPPVTTELIDVDHVVSARMQEPEA